MTKILAVLALVLLTVQGLFAQEVTSPKAGDILYRDELYLIKWKASGMGDAVWIHLLDPEHSEQIYFVAASYPDVGVFEWTVKQGVLKGTNLVLRVFYSPGMQTTDIPITIIPGHRPPAPPMTLPQPTAKIKKSVEVVWKSETNAFYHIVKSDQVPPQWQVVELLVIGTGEEIIYHASSESGKEFFSVERLSKTPDFTSASLYAPKLENAELRHAVFSQSVILSGSLEKSDLTYAKFNGAVLSWMSFKSTWLLGSDFSEAFVSFVDFTSADLRGANFTDTTFVYCDFSGSNMNDYSQWGPTKGSAKFIHCTMPNGTIYSSP